MSKLYRDYFWKEGIPYGIDGREGLEDGFKIVMDPYRKRISIETYSKGNFTGVAYDSALLNFRHLKPAEQMAWQKFKVQETKDAVECLIRNQDDRVIVKEIYLFENGVCRECRAYSPQGVPLSIQRMFYTSLNDPFNGVILYDLLEHPVIFKRYAISEETGEFSELLEEKWTFDSEKAMTFDSKGTKGT